jgi:hypothetical protein
MAAGCDWRKGGLVEMDENTVREVVEGLRSDGVNVVQAKVKPMIVKIPGKSPKWQDALSLTIQCSRCKTEYKVPFSPGGVNPPSLCSFCACSAEAERVQRRAEDTISGIEVGVLVNALKTVSETNTDLAQQLIETAISVLLRDTASESIEAQYKLVNGIMDRMGEQRLIAGDTKLIHLLMEKLPFDQREKICSNHMYMIAHRIRRETPVPEGYVLAYCNTCGLLRPCRKPDPIRADGWTKGAVSLSECRCSLDGLVCDRCANSFRGWSHEKLDLKPPRCGEGAEL